MGLPTKNLSTEWSRIFWMNAQKVAKKMRVWPKWKKLSVEKAINPINKSTKDE